MGPFGWVLLVGSFWLGPFVRDPPSSSTYSHCTLAELASSVASHPPNSSITELPRLILRTTCLLSSFVVGPDFTNAFIRRVYGVEGVQIGVFAHLWGLVAGALSGYILLKDVRALYLPHHPMLKRYSYKRTRLFICIISMN